MKEPESGSAPGEHSHPCARSRSHAHARARCSHTHAVQICALLSFPALFLVPRAGWQEARSLLQTASGVWAEHPRMEPACFSLAEIRSQAGKNERVFFSFYFYFLALFLCNSVHIMRRYLLSSSRSSTVAACWLFALPCHSAFHKHRFILFHVAIGK